MFNIKALYDFKAEEDVSDPQTKPLRIKKPKKDPPSFPEEKEMKMEEQNSFHSFSGGPIKGRYRGPFSGEIDGIKVEEIQIDGSINGEFSCHEI